MPGIPEPVEPAAQGGVERPAGAVVLTLTRAPPDAQEPRLRAVRGIALGLVLSAGMWVVIWLLVRRLF